MDNQQNQQSASGGYTYVGELQDSAFVVGRQIQNILLLGPAVLALRLTPNGGVSLEILAQCHCELAPNKHEGAEHKQDCAFMKLLAQQDSLPGIMPRLVSELGSAKVFQTATEASLHRVTIEKRLKITVSLED